MKFGNTVRPVMASMSLALVASVAQAGPQYFFGNTPSVQALPAATVPETNESRKEQTKFTGAVDASSIVTQTFETTPTGNLGLNAGTLIGSLLGGTGSLSQAAVPLDTNGDPIYSGPKLLDAAGMGRFNTTQGGSKFFETDWSFTVNIGSAVDAFAFFGTDFGDFDGRLEIELWLGNTRKAENVFLDNSSGTPRVPNVLEDQNKPSDSGSVLFFGFATDEYKFDRLEFRIFQGSQTPDLFDTLGFDDLRVANLGVTNIPEPASLALAGLALAAAGWARKSRRRA